MQKRIGNISHIFAWVITLMFFAHGIFPHNHHFDSIYDHSRQADHNEDIPRHCHAFNDLVVDRPITLVDIPIIPVTHSMLVSATISGLYNHQKTFILLLKVNDNGNLPKTLCLKNALTRGSPSMV